MPKLYQRRLRPRCSSNRDGRGPFITPSLVGHRLTLSAFLVFLALVFWTCCVGRSEHSRGALLIVSFVILGHLLPRDEMNCPADSEERAKWNFPARDVLGRKQRLLMATATPGSPYRASPTSGPTPADVEKQLETIRDDITELTQQVADLVSQAKDSTMDQVKSQVRSAKAQVDSALAGAQETGRDAVDAFRDVADTFGDAIEDSLRRRPYATLLWRPASVFVRTAWRR